MDAIKLYHTFEVQGVSFLLSQYPLVSELKVIRGPVPEGRLDI